MLDIVQVLEEVIARHYLAVVVSLLVQRQCETVALLSFLAALVLFLFDFCLGGFHSSFAFIDKLFVVLVELG